MSSTPPRRQKVKDDAGRQNVLTRDASTRWAVELRGVSCWLNRGIFTPENAPGRSSPGSSQQLVSATP